MKKDEIPPFVKLLSVALTLIVFAVGFWHTHLGLKEMRPFNSDYGSISIAAIILLLLVISYYFALAGKRSALFFYIICGLFFFVFNLNYFYPSYLSRQLVKEEAIALNDTLKSYVNRIDHLSESGATSDVSKLYKLKYQILDEVKSQDGFGRRAKDYLSQFNKITGGNLKPNRTIGASDLERLDIADRYSILLNNEIKDYVIDQMNSGVKINAEKLYMGITELDSTERIYTPALKKIIADDSEMSLDSIRFNPQIKTLQNLVTDIDNATIKINEAGNEKVFEKLNETKVRNLGRIAHTISSAKQRISKIDTWGIIILCLFIDLLVPLAIYLLLRRKDYEQDEEFGFWKFFKSNKNFNN